ncbi:GNAT family N-acetyltransferase [Variovorax sp. HJSM1_2]|uniref:GNAT family N-acetyltransferase n=1 Tax=Variovorax sp. HJSM1_2 TaxID=3366263 RepID=UPI003BE50523
MSDQFVYTDVRDPRAKPLIDALTEEYDRRYGDFYNVEGTVREMQKYPPEVFAPPHGNFVLLLRNGQAIGGGAFKRFDERTAEFKRVWTDARLRRQGLARKVLRELEAQAQRQGYTRIYLTTGCRQPEAVGLYLSEGYDNLFDPAIDPEILRSLPFEKTLKTQAQAEPRPGYTARSGWYNASVAQAAS